MTASAIDAAIERGREAQSGKPKWEPVGVDHPGWLTARVKDLRSGEVEGVFFAQGKWQYRRLGRDKEDKVKSYDVRDRELRKIARAMIGQDPLTAPEWRGELVAECARVRAEEASTRDAPKKKGRVRRGKG